MNPPPLFVTGATSHSGSHLLRLLHRRNLPARLLVRNPQKLDLPAESNFEVIHSDLEDICRQFGPPHAAGKHNIGKQQIDPR